MRRSLLALVLVVIAACGSRPADPRSGWTKVETAGGATFYAEVPLPDGRIIPCLSTYEGLSCDWRAR